WGLSTINVRGSAYYTNYNRSDNGGGVRPQCTYDPLTGEFVGWVGVEIDKSDYNTCLGKSEVLTIGNAEHVYQVGTFDSTSFNSSFTISDIKVDLYDASANGNTFTPSSIIAEDIGPALVADNIDEDGQWYFDYKDNTKSSDHEKDLIRASQNKWHIDGEKSLVSFVNIDDISAYAPKYSAHISGATGILSAFASVEADKTYGFVYKNKYESGAKAKPFVEFITESGTQKYDTANYISDTETYYNSVITFKTPANLAEGKNIRLGVEIPSATTDATFGGFELFEIGEDGMMIRGNNLLKKIYIKENAVLKPYSSDEEIGVWMKEGTIGDTGTQLDIIYCEDSYYLLAGKPNMLIFQGKEKKLSDNDVSQATGDPGEFIQTLRIEKNTRYRFSANLKFAGTGYEGDKFGITLSYNNKTGTNKTLSSYDDLSDNSKYLIKYEFNSPSSLLSKGNNFTVKLNIPNGFVSGYLANVSLVEIDASGNEISENLVKSGNFIDGDYTGWTRNNGFFMFKFSKIPENFFSTNPTNNIHAIQYRDTGNYDILQQQYLLLKPGVRYELSYTTLLTGKGATEPYGVVYTRIINKDKTDSSWGSGLRDNERNPNSTDYEIYTTKVVLNEKALKAVQGEDDYDSSEAIDHAIRVTKVFTVDGADILPIYQSYNTSIRFYFMTGSSGYIADYQLYEIDENGKRLSNNIMLDGDFSAGFDTLDTYAGIDKTPWNYSGGGLIRNLELENGFFRNYTVPKKIIRSDGDAENVTYGNRLYVDPCSRYYFSGKYVKTNFVGVAPEVFYRSKAANGEYVAISFEQYYDAGRYYFETDGGFTIPDDAVINDDGKADIIVRMNNLNYGKGYFCGLTLTQDNSTVNLFDDSKAQLNGFKELNYDPDILTPFEGDDKFEDGNWSGEAAEPITVGAIVGVVYDKNGAAASGVRMKLMPGNIISMTGADGVYNFDNLTPGEYSLYLVENSGNAILCCNVTVQESVLLTLPDIYYDDDPDSESGDIDISGEPVAKNYGVIKGYCYDSSGNLLAGVDIYANNKSHHVKTDEKGMFEFDKVPPGEYKICTILDDGSAYIFKTVKVEAGKGTLVKVMMPDPDGDGLPLWALIAIIAGGAVLVAGGVVAVLLIVLKKKKKRNASAA
ncbi:MAG: carboxypeptidase regulatory-like domain-containing protein, partial [Clostridia bacterium]|nr:carboxypeptidase regulatory-like domain-containing protein [Clostridia bacterium]